DVSHLRSLDERILDLHLLHDTLLLVKVRGDGKEVVGSLVRREELQSVAIIAAVSDDVDIRDRESTIWGLFTRFDCERDVLFAHQELIGATPVYRGAMGIDATWKRGYPAPLVMTDEIRRRVDEHWESYWL
ncbi:MAG: hypothetical protein WBH55_13095, partial [Bacteroidota bacterium]